MKRLVMVLCMAALLVLSLALPSFAEQPYLAGGDGIKGGGRGEAAFINGTTLDISGGAGGPSIVGGGGGGGFHCTYDYATDESDCVGGGEQIRWPTTPGR